MHTQETGQHHMQWTVMHAQIGNWSISYYQFIYVKIIDSPVMFQYIRPDK